MEEELNECENSSVIKDKNEHKEGKFTENCTINIKKSDDLSSQLKKDRSSKIQKLEELRKRRQEMSLYSKLRQLKTDQLKANRLAKKAEKNSKVNENKETENSNKPDEKWEDIKPFLNVNDHIQGPISHGVCGPKTELECIIDHNIAKGDLETAEILSDTLANREFAVKITNAFAAKRYAEQKAEEAAAEAKKQKKIRWGTNSTRASGVQMERLISCLEENPKLLDQKFSCTFSKKDSEKLWDNLSEQLNSLNGAGKSAEKWKRTWRDYRRNVKERALQHKKTLSITGNETSSTDSSCKLTRLEERALRLINLSMREGIAEASESIIVSVVDPLMGPCADDTHLDTVIEPSTALEFDLAGSSTASKFKPVIHILSQDESNTEFERATEHNTETQEDTEAHLIQSTYSEHMHTDNIAEDVDDPQTIPIITQRTKHINDPYERRFQQYSEEQQKQVDTLKEDAAMKEKSLANEERRLTIEEQKLALEERRLAIQEECMNIDQKQLEMQERLLNVVETGLNNYAVLIQALIHAMNGGVQQ